MIPFSRRDPKLNSSWALLKDFARHIGLIAEEEICLKKLFCTYCGGDKGRQGPRPT